MKPAIKNAVPSHIDPERIARIALTAVRQNPRLAQCSPASFGGALLQSAQLGLEVNTPLGHAYLIPYKGEATLQIGYKGRLDLAHRTGLFKDIYAEEVYANDVLEVTKGLRRDLIHRPAAIPEGEPVAYYAVYRMKSGGENFVVWSREKIIAHGKKFSMGFNNASGPWKKSFDSMAKKTVLIDVLKYAPVSPEFREQEAAAALDGQVIKYDPKTNEQTVELPSRVAEDNESVEAEVVAHEKAMEDAGI
jgi:recombination protein RecT